MPVPSLYISAAELVSPAGWGLTSHLASLNAERCHLRSYDGSIEGRLPSSVEALLRSMAAEKNLRNQDPLTRLAVLATRSLGEQRRIAKGYGAIIGSSRGATSQLEASWSHFSGGGRLLPSTSPTTTAGSLPAAVAHEAGLSGPSLFVSAACATGMHAVIQACATIRLGMATGMLAGGVEYANTPFTLAMLRAAKVYSENSRDDFPCQPAGPERSGMVLSEGAALLLLETDPLYQPLGEIVGWGAATESSTLTGISADGDVLVRAIDQALTIAGLASTDVDLIVGHGAGTVKGDAAELCAYQRLFTPELPVVWHKWMIGHMLGASACASIILGLSHLHEGLVPAHPYLPFGHPSRESRRLTRQRYMLVTALGFGGNAAALIVKNPAFG